MLHDALQSWGQSGVSAEWKVASFKLDRQGFNKNEAIGLLNAFQIKHTFSPVHLVKPKLNLPSTHIYYIFINLISWRWGIFPLPLIRTALFSSRWKKHGNIYGITKEKEQQSEIRVRIKSLQLSNVKGRCPYIGVVCDDVLINSLKSFGRKSVFHVSEWKDLLKINFLRRGICW